MKIKILLLVMLGLLAGRKLQAQFSLSGEFRPRAEYRNGFKTLRVEDQQAAFQISQRSRLNIQYITDKTQAFVSLQDVRLWGETPQLVAASNRLMLHQAWFSVGIAKNLSLKLGRQELVYDDARIFGNVDWAQQARAHDLALLRYENKFKLHAGFAFNQQNDLLFTTRYELAGNYKSMQFVWFNKKWSSFNLSLLFLNNGLERKYTKDSLEMFETVFSQTAGMHAEWKKDKLRLTGSYYMTKGTDIAKRTLDAYNAKAEVSYDLTASLKSSIGFETLSGTSEKEKLNYQTSYVNKSFNPFYGTNHKFNGFMDYFYVGNHANNVGLNDLHVGIVYTTGLNQMNLTVHQFSAAADVLQPQSGTEVMDRALGTEVDLSLSRKIHETATLSGGYSQMFGTTTLQKLKGGDHKVVNNWAWIMITYKPKFL